MFKGGVQVAQRLGKTVVIDEWLAQLDRLGQPLAGNPLLTQQALATALPAFQPYADMTQSDVDDCMDKSDFDF